MSFHQTTDVHTLAAYSVSEALLTAGNLLISSSVGDGQRKPPVCLAWPAQWQSPETSPHRDIFMFRNQLPLLSWRQGGTLGSLVQSCLHLGKFSFVLARYQVSHWNLLKGEPVGKNWKHASAAEVDTFQGHHAGSLKHWGWYEVT